MTRPATPKVCRLLRTKTSFGASDDWKRGESPTAAYWCLATMEAFGADDGYVHATACVRGRACFEPCREDEEKDETVGEGEG